MKLEHKVIVGRYCTRGFSCNPLNRRACPFSEVQRDGYCLGNYARPSTHDLELKISEVIQTYPEFEPE